MGEQFILFSFMSTTLSHQTLLTSNTVKHHCQMLFTWHTGSSLSEESLVRYESVKLVPPLPAPVLALREFSG